MKQPRPIRLPAFERIAAFFFLVCFILDLVIGFASFGQLKGITAVFGGIDQLKGITAVFADIGLFFTGLFFIKILREEYKRKR